MNARELFEAPLPDRPFWAGDGLLPKNGILLLGGPAKIGKSFLLMDLAHSLASGVGKVWGRFPVEEAARVLYIEQEIGLYGVQKRLKMRYSLNGVRPPEEFHICAKGSPMLLDLPDGVIRLKQEIRQTRAQVVIIDPVSRFLHENENDNTAVAAFFRALDRCIAEFPELSFVLAHHFGKAPRGDFQEGYDPLDMANFRGASNFFGMPDTLVMLQRLPPMHKSEWWRLKCRAVMRQAESPGDFFLSFGPGGWVQQSVGLWSKG